MKKRTRAMVEAALMVLFMSAFTVIAFYIPVLSMMLFLIPVPLMVIGKRYGTHFMILSIVAWTLIAGSIVGYNHMAIFTLLIGIPALMMGYMMNKEYKSGNILIGGAVGTLAAGVLGIYILMKLSGINLMDQISESFKISLDMYKNMGMSPEKLDLFEERIDLIFTIIPSTMIISSSVLAYINYVLTVKIMRKTGCEIEELPKFKNIRLPRSIIMGTFLIMILTMITQYFEIVNYESLVLNVITIFHFIYFVQGFAVVSYFLNVLKMKKPLRIIIYILIIFGGTGSLMVAVVGFIDALINLRKLKLDR